MTEKLYRLKPWRWYTITKEPNAMRLEGTEFYVVPRSCGFWAARHDDGTWISGDVPAIETAQRQCERLALRQVLQLLEEVPPPEPQGPIQP